MGKSIIPPLPPKKGKKRKKNPQCENNENTYLLLDISDITGNYCRKPSLLQKLVIPKLPLLDLPHSLLHMSLHPSALCSGPQEADLSILAQGLPGSLVSAWEPSKEHQLWKGRQK